MFALTSSRNARHRQNTSSMTAKARNFTAVLRLVDSTNRRHRMSSLAAAAGVDLHTALIALTACDCADVTSNAADDDVPFDVALVNSLAKSWTEDAIPAVQ